MVFFLVDPQLAATRAGVGWRDESGRGVEEDTVTTAAGMLSRGGGGRWTKRLQGGGGRCEASSSLRRTTMTGGVFPRRQRDANGCGDAAVVPSDQRRR